MLTARAALRSLLVALSLAAPLAFVAAARADVACGDQTCPKNYACQSQPAACPAIACAKDDANCTQPACSGTVETCEPLPCASDSDCADGMVCYTSTEQDCPTAPACAKDQPCAQPADTACTTRTVSACVPKYLLPCATDTDCGAGFTCDEEQACGCSGSASSGSSGAGGTPLPAADGGAGDATPPSSDPPEAADGGAPPPDCSCQPSGTKACNLKTVACSADADCPASFTCGNNPNGECFADANGNSGCTADPAKICLPPYAHTISIGPVAKDGGEASGNSGTPTASGSGTQGSSVPPSSDTSGASAASTSPKSDTPASEDGGGCSMAPAPGSVGTSLGFAALALVGLVGARRRRQR